MSSSCTSGRRKFTINSDRIFLGVPGFALGFAIGEFIGDLSTSYAYIATGLLLGTSISTVLGVTIPIPWRRNLNWFILVLLIGNFVCSIFYLIIITHAEELGLNQIENSTLPAISPNLTETTLIGNNLESIESQNGTKNATHDDNSSPARTARSQTQGLQSSIAFIILGILLTLNSLAAAFVKLDETNPDAVVLPVPVEESELKPLDKRENQTVDNDNNESQGGVTA